MRSLQPLRNPAKEGLKPRRVLDVPKALSGIPPRSESAGFIFLRIGDVEVDPHASPFWYGRKAKSGQLQPVQFVMESRS
jgi:hypothetical protein